ncbi:MAG: silent information regulator protein Sir2, partial [Bacteroidales bacterium]
MLLFSGFVTDIASQEKIFANYFDILTGSPGGSEVIGRIHLERNKDVLTSPVPGGYHFEITAQPSDLIEVKTHYDEANRIMGILSVKAGMAMPAEPCVYPLSVVLLDRDTPLNRFDVSVKVVDKTLWQTMYDRYKGFTLDNSRLYGRNKMSDAEIGKRIIEIEQNEGYFMNFPSYTTHPADYLKQKKVKGKPKRGEPTIENEWQEITNIFGGMGYAYAKSAIYGPKGDPGARLRLKRALYKGLRVYMNSVPVEGSDLLIGGKPIGNHTGDGFSLLLSHHLSGVQTPTHQWNMTDALVTPTIHLMPDLLKDIKNGDQEALDLYHANIRYFQLFFSIVERRRPIDDPDNRWGEIQDTLYSSGAWSDANLGHRLRTMLALPILWADYNRPLTYVPYWYSSFYGDKPFANFSFSPGWSP